MGYKIVVDDKLMSKTVEDWSLVRSPGRAKRRLKVGFRQNISYKTVPKEEYYLFKAQNTIIMHSTYLMQLRKKAYDYENYISKQYSKPYQPYPYGIR